MPESAVLPRQPQSSVRDVPLHQMSRAGAPRWLTLIAVVAMRFQQFPAAAADEHIDFVRDVRPILRQHCYDCHGPDVQKSGLRLDVKAAAWRGGELYGAAIVADSADDSPLFAFVDDPEADLVMPPDGPRVPVHQRNLLRRWIDSGAVWPDGVDEAQLVDRTNHWSFHPVLPVDVPADGQGWARQQLDHFVMARLTRNGLQPAVEADRRTWLRRVTLDLTGLPPTWSQTRDFLTDSDADAYEKVVERLLQSPRYGERAAQHWLDVVRYADTHGFEVNTERPNAWPYRDYVIDAFNRDVPYDQFVRQQLVGDAMNEDAATGFLVTASVLLPGQIGKDEPSRRLARQDAIDEIVVNIGQTFLGLSIGCARCHDHKFDAIRQADYYAMQAFVAGVEYEERPIASPAAQAEAVALRKRLHPLQRQLLEALSAATHQPSRPPVNARENLEIARAEDITAVRFTILSTNRLEPCIDELEVFDESGRNLALSRHGTTVVASGSRVSVNRHELQFINDGRYGNSSSWMSDEVGGGWVMLQFDRPVSVRGIVWGRDRNGKYADRLPTQYRIELRTADDQWHPVADHTDRAVDADAAESSADGVQQQLLATLPPADGKRVSGLLRQQRELRNRLEAVADGTRPVFAGRFRNPDEIRRLRRGDPEQPQEVMAPAVPVALARRHPVQARLSADSVDQDRRRTLADWIASPHNPLTARVMVNRIWQSHFGVGLVPTANDFGRNGQPPSHPALLDWLAQEFIDAGWSVRHLHRQIVLSSTYRQSTVFDSAAARSDAAARFLWRFPLRRLDGESIRDSILATSGQLNLTMGGPGFSLFDKRGGLSGFQPVESFPPDGLRRMIYAHRVRRERDPVFGAFDCPDGGQSTPRRRESTTPIQALNLLNSRFVVEQARHFADRVQRQAPSDPRRQIAVAWQLALQREPTDQEIQDADPLVRQYGLPAVCRALFNCNEFLFLQ